MSELFTADTSFPPALGSWPFLAMVVRFAFWVLMLVCLQWIYSVVDDKKTMPAPSWSYVGMNRNVKLLLLSAAAIRTAPLLVLLNGWGPLSPHARQVIAGASYVIYIPVAIGIVIAWWLDRQLRSSETGKILAYRAMEFTSEQGGVEKRRAILALVLILVVAVATTVIRPQPAHDTRTIAIVGAD